MRIAIGPIDLPNTLNFKTDSGNPHLTSNPGIGGTEFQSILIALTLASIGYQVDLIAGHGSLSTGTFFSIPLSEATEHSYDLQIVPLGLLQKYGANLIQARRRIVVSHHPHDLTQSHRQIISKCDILVSVGEYQYWSNWRSPICHVWLPGLSRPPIEGPSKTPNDSITIGHISSLHPSKGFHVIAQAWTTIARNLPNARLEVVGGLELYGLQVGDNQIPTSAVYAEKIRKKFKGEVPSSVTFLGVLPSHLLDERVKNWDLAILNPIGTGEADPGVVRDCLRLGVPVVSTGAFGMGDYMTHFPDLQASSPRAVAKKTIKFFSSPIFRKVSEDCALELSREVFLRSSRTLVSWNQLVEVACENDYEAKVNSLGFVPKPLGMKRTLILMLGYAKAKAIELASYRRWT